ncbi:MAG: hypothetical protein QXD03_03820 [Candidatus Anstonellales archaeon]
MINIEEVKKYNEALRGYKEKLSRVEAELEFNMNELNRLCKELSAELGIEVTIDNIEQIYNDRVEKVKNTLINGREIIERIKAEENNTNVINNIQL